MILKILVIIFGFISPFTLGIVLGIIRGIDELKEERELLYNDLIKIQGL